MDKRLEFDIYPVTCEELSNGRSDDEVLEGFIAGGARIVQLRDKKIPKKKFYEKALRFRERTARSGVTLIINDYIDIALAVGADGVHLGQDDLPLAAARKIAPNLIIGISTHSKEEAVQAQQDGASYINIGPIFGTQTKAVQTAPLEPESIELISSIITIPFTVMGGIKYDNIDSVLQYGARRIAVVTALTQADDIAAATKLMRDKITQHLHQNQ